MQNLPDNYAKIQEPLTTPQTLRERLPASPALLNTVKIARQVISEIILGKDKRLLVIAGPCSIHDPQAALEYAYLLKALAKRLENQLYIVMRVYFEKPRTLLGWKGLISDPYLDSSFKINEGLILARKLLLQLGDLGLPAATEFLDPLITPYLSELISWGTIGARTVESQIHRELASGLGMPIGFKNNTEGNIKAAVDAVNAARHSHYGLSTTPDGIPSILCTPGNPLGHIVLRGSHTQSNYDIQSIQQAVQLLENQQLTPRLMIDCSHGNSMKDYRRQAKVADYVAAARQNKISSILGIMLESHLVAGKQEPQPQRLLRYGQSITDACVGWEETVTILENLANQNI